MSAKTIKIYVPFFHIFSYNSKLYFFRNKSENQHQSPYTGNFNVEKRNWNRAKHLTSYFYDK